MPTFARVVAAVLFGALAYYVSTLIPPLFEGERPLPSLPYWNAFFGVLLGWRQAGRLAGRGFGASVSSGVTTSVSLFVTCLFAHSFAEMIDRSMRGQYGGPAEAVVAVFNLMYEFGETIFTNEVLTSTIVGGIAAAMVTEIFSRRYD
ncbi:MAG: TrgA family protein [Pseudomonadota bacterium]